MQKFKFNCIAQNNLKKFYHFKLSLSHFDSTLSNLTIVKYQNDYYWYIEKTV